MPTLATVASFLRKQTLPLLLVLGVILGLIAPAAGKAFANAHIDTFIVALIFFISGLSLRTQEIHTVWTLRLWGLLILFIVLFITPLCALFILEIPLEPKDLAIGLAVFSTAPTTLSTCVIFSRQAGGHWPLALAISISSNFLATFTVPYILKFLFDAVGQVELNPIDLLQKLALMILLPLTIGKLFQKIKSVSDFQTRNKERLSLMSGVGICFIPWIQLSESEESLKGVDVEHLAYVLLLCFGLHLCFLGIGFVTARVLRADWAMTVTMLMTIGQKTLPVSLTVISSFPDDIGDAGLMAIPCLMGHLVQTLFDSFLANYLSTKQPEMAHLALEETTDDVLHDSHVELVDMHKTEQVDS